MIDMLTAVTFEMDDAATAVAEIAAQLELTTKLRKNAVGIISCYPEFLETEVAKAICGSLPFDVLGCTTMGNGNSAGQGQMMLSLAVLTSDEVSFSAAVSAPLGKKEYLDHLKEVYQRAAAALPEKPSLLISFAPMVDYLSGDVMIEALNDISGGLPIFGTLPSDHTTDYSQSHTIFNGELYGDAMPLLLLSGPVNPRFFIISIPEKNRQKQQAIITSSEGNVLHKVNDMPLLDYLATLGISSSTGMDSIKIVPFVVDYNDGTTPVARGIYRFMSDGSAMCGGLMPCHSTLSIGSLEYDDVISTAKEIIGKALAVPDVNCLLIFSCICRGWALGMDTMAELETVREAVNGAVPYAMCYAGGEICPVYNEQGETFNRFHNYTCVLCAL